MKTPDPTGLKPSNFSSIALYGGDHRKTTPPDAPSIAEFFGLAVTPYVRTPARAPIAARGTLSAALLEPKKIPMRFNPPRFKMTKAGQREETWLLVIISAVVTVTMPLGSYTLTASNLGTTVKDSRDGRSYPIATVRAALARIADRAEVDAACALLADACKPPTEPKARVCTVTDAHRTAQAAGRERAHTADAEMAARRKARKAAPPAKVENFESEAATMTASQLAELNARDIASAHRGCMAALDQVRAGRDLPIA